ncbi:hypothetical protein ABTX79_28370, partial [Streptomyces sp. NPDC096153]
VAGTLLVRHLSGGEGTGGTSPSPTAAALPASWAGTRVGTGPGAPDADGVTRPRTGQFAVTPALHPALRGEPAGKQVSKVTETVTGREPGCTEALQLREVRGTSMVFETVTGHPTDRTAAVSRPEGNIYVVTMTDPDTPGLGEEGAQSAGAPSVLNRR